MVAEMNRRNFVSRSRPARLVARWTSVALLTGGLLSFGPATPVAVAANAQPAEGRVVTMVRGSRNAVGLRFGLLGFVGVALAGGAYAQYQSLATLRRGGAAPRGRMRSTASVTAPTPAPQRAAVLAPPVQLRAVPSHDDRQILAEEYCAQAIAAAQRYDRRTSRAAFASALASYPDVKPSNLPGFWDLPSSGHVDLARAYLDRGQILDARSVLTFAAMLFPHNRDLEALMREAAVGGRVDRTA